MEDIKMKKISKVTNAAAPVLWFGSGRYDSANPKAIGDAGDWKDKSVFVNGR